MKEIFSFIFILAAVLFFAVGITGGVVYLIDRATFKDNHITTQPFNENFQILDATFLKSQWDNCLQQLEKEMLSCEKR